MSTQHRIVIGDARRMSALADRSVQLVVTSPPYWQLKDYGVAGEIGFDDSYEVYINDLNLVWRECDRVLAPGCRCCINIGDQFARAATYGRYKVIPIRAEIIRYCEAIGLDYMGAVIWQKVTTTNTTGGATIMGSFPYPRNGILKLDYEFILIFKKRGDAPRPDADAKERARLSTLEWNEYFAGHWNFAGEKQDGHIARFPVELPHRLIRMFSFPGETVLDPFAGSGTTSVAAARLERHSVGFEIHPEFAALARARLEMEAASHPIELRLETADALNAEALSGLRESLPHRFVDPVRIDSETDPRRKHFGSRITGKEAKPPTGYRVRRVLQSLALELDDGRTVELRGIVPLAGKETEAVEYLTRVLKGRPVTLKFDDESGTGPLRAYVYLSNRSFVNGHLLREGLAALDVNTAGSKRHALERFAAKHSRLARIFSPTVPVQKA